MNYEAIDDFININILIMPWKIFNIDEQYVLHVLDQSQS